VLDRKKNIPMPRSITPILPIKNVFIKKIERIQTV